MFTKRLFAVAVVGLLVAASPAAAAGGHATSTADGSLSVHTEYQDGALLVHVDEQVDGAATVTVRPAGDAAYADAGTYEVNGSDSLELTAPDGDRTLSITATTDAGDRVTQVVRVDGGDGLLDSGDTLTVVSESAVTANSSSGATTDDTSQSSGDGGVFGIDVGLGGEASGDARAGNGAADDGGPFGVDVSVGGTIDHVRATVDGWLQSALGVGASASGSAGASGSASAGA